MCVCVCQYNKNALVGRTTAVEQMRDVMLRPPVKYNRAAAAATATVVRDSSAWPRGLWCLQATGSLHVSGVPAIYYCAPLRRRPSGAGNGTCRDKCVCVCVCVCKEIISRFTSIIYKYTGWFTKHVHPIFFPIITLNSEFEILNYRYLILKGYIFDILYSKFKAVYSP